MQLAESSTRDGLSKWQIAMMRVAALAVGLALHDAHADGADKEPPRPNVIVIFADDLGYGDLGCFGHPTIATPHLDRMAREGLRLTQFYAAECVCTPSRAALLTGRLPIRNGMCGDKRRVLFSNSTGGLPSSELTLAEVFKSKDYATACIGKWHLGHRHEHLPLRHGFDSYYGIPYSNDMQPTLLMRDDTVIENPVDQTTLTARYTAEAVSFIRQHRGGPFFLYLAHNFPHTPLFASAEFKGKSRRGLYGDVVEELDASVGQVLAALAELGLDKNTLVLFTSDNGPWLIKKQDGGSAGLLRGGKGSTWEGGMREPTIAWWPGTIPAGRTSDELASTMDLFATAHSLLELPLPAERTLDSHDLRPLLLGKGPSSRKAFFYYRGTKLMAARVGPWKAHFLTQDGYGQPAPDVHDPPLLFNLEVDPSEQYDVAGKHAEVIAEIRQAVAAHVAQLQPAPSQLE